MDLAHDIVLFDGVCNLCNRSVQFIIRHDKKGHFKFAALQSTEAQRILAMHSVPPSSTQESILLISISRHKVYKQSSAVLRIGQQLDGLWKITAILLIIPKFLRDWGYRYMAQNRYKWFGKTKTCMVPSPEIKSRFL